MKRTCVHVKSGVVPTWLEFLRTPANEYIGEARLRKEPISPWFMTQKGWDSRPENKEGPQSKIQPVSPSPDLELEGPGARTNNLGVSVSGTNSETAWSLHSPFNLEWVSRLRKAGQQPNWLNTEEVDLQLGNTALERCPEPQAEWELELQSGLEAFRSRSEVLPYVLVGNGAPIPIQQKLTLWSMKTRLIPLSQC